MAKRPLSEDEKTLCKKALNKYDEAKRRLNVKLRELDHMISEGLYINYLEKIDELKQKKNQVCQEIQEMDVHSVTLRDQIKRGVEVKNNKPGE